MNPIGRIAWFVCFSFWAFHAFAGDWYRWRGPQLNGISRETDWIETWPADGPPVVWNVSVETGFSSVVVADGRLFTMGNEDNTDTVFCLDALTGKELWSHSYECPLGDRFFEGGPTSTPTVDAQLVYTLSRQGELFCFECTTGNVRWSKNIATAANVRIPGWGFSGAPLVSGDLLLLNVGEAGTAVEKTTGEIVWTSADREAGYATPVPFRRDGRWYAMIASRKHFIAVDIETGKEQWRHRWLTRYGCNAADAIVADDFIFLSSGYNRGAAVLKIADDKPSVIWANKEMQNQMSTCILLAGYLYGIDGNTNSEKFLKCVDLQSGEVQWSRKGIGLGALTAANGKLIILNENGELIIGRASPEAFDVSARAQVLDGKCWTVPVLSNGRIYCRNAGGDLVCVDVRPR